MATRYYFPSTGAAAVEPDFYSGAVGWDKTSEADRLAMVTTKISSAFATKACTENVSTDPYDVCNRQYVSAPIGVHDFNSVVTKIQIRCIEDATKMDALLRWFARCMSNDGSVERFIIGWYSGDTEFDDGNLTNRGYSHTRGVGSVTSENGDRIVVDIGINTTNTKTDVYTATMDFGDNSGTDLPENETETTQYNPWIEFSHDIAPYVEDLSINVSECEPCSADKEQQRLEEIKENLRNNKWA